MVSPLLDVGCILQSAAGCRGSGPEGVPPAGLAPRTDPPLRLEVVLKGFLALLLH